MQRKVFQCQDNKKSQTVSGYGELELRDEVYQETKMNCLANPPPSTQAGKLVSPVTLSGNTARTPHASHHF